MKKERCVICRGRRHDEAEGRVIDGTWFKDTYLPKSYWGKWVCGWNCYQKLLEQKGSEENAEEEKAFGDALEGFLSWLFDKVDIRNGPCGTCRYFLHDFCTLYKEEKDYYDTCYEQTPKFRGLIDAWEHAISKIPSGKIFVAYRKKGLREALKQVLTHLENTLMIEGKTKKNEELLEEYLQTYGGEV